MNRSRKRTTILRQLILSVLLPVVVLITVMSIYNFYDQKNQIIHTREEIIDQLQLETSEFLTFYDITILELEKAMSAEAEDYSHQLVYDVFRKTDKIEILDMDSLKLALGMPDLVDIYIIDTNGVVVNTSYDPDLGLNFYARGEYFVNHFKEVWERQVFMEDRISVEGNTRLPKKYTYQSTLDTNYIVELGIYNQTAIKLVTHLVDKLNKMSDKYEEIDTVTLYFGTTYFMNYQKHDMRESHMSIATSTLETGKSQSIKEESGDRTYTTEFHFLTMEKSKLHEGYLLRVIHNDSKLQALLLSQLKQFLLNIVIFVLPIFLLIIWRARSLAKPISELVEKIDRIQSKRALEERVPIRGNNEVTELGIHFNSMVKELQESYRDLEQKIADRTKEVVEQKEIIEEVYHEIQDSIKYAKRLQQAILPSLADLETHLDDFFIFFKPKDVVSGDFYWFEQVDGLSFIAAADCTGHGVPGAMVSVVCSNALHQAVNEFGLRHPSAILDKTRELVIKTFAKSGENVKDGMDIALCVIDFNQKKVRYAGANNPLWIVRDNAHITEEQRVHRSTYQDESRSLIEFKASKQPVGLYENMSEFDEGEVKLHENDVLYLFTDGYADQFGGIKGKKLKYKPFKKILIDASDQSMADQRDSLESTFDNWKGSFEQVDDVCVIGVRMSQ